MSFTPHPSATAVLAARDPAPTKAYQAVLDAIVSGATPPGTLVTEGAVADALRMSRTPVREAFLRLEVEGLLRLYPKRGAVVAIPDDASERDLLETRRVLEIAAIRWLGERGVPPELAARLEHLIGEQEAAADALAFARADRALHEAIVEASGNAVAAALFAQIGPQLMRFWHRLAGSDEARARLVAEHRKLAARALAGDADGYAKAIAAHLDGERRGR